MVAIGESGYVHASNDQVRSWPLVVVVVLAIVGTGLAKVLYNKMVHMATPVFASSVTYLIPIVAIFWGVLDGEQLSFLQLLAGAIILFGVYLVNKAKS